MWTGSYPTSTSDPRLEYPSYEQDEAYREGEAEYLMDKEDAELYDD